MDKICERCGTPFKCYHDDVLNCHCALIALDAQQREYIGQNYDDCLCHACLQEIKIGFYALDVNQNRLKDKKDKSAASSVVRCRTINNR
jgi:hypothetical protein